MPIKPTCLHIPTLYEEATATLSWESVDNADGYELDCVFDETFEQASEGRSWTALDAAGKTWVQMDAEDLTWSAFEALVAQGLAWQTIECDDLTWSEMEAKDLTWNGVETLPVRFTIFKGLGKPTCAPDQGLTWTQLNSKEETWSQIEADDLNWLEFELQPSIGLNWEQLDNDGDTWTQIAPRDLTWQQFEEQPTRGLSWESLDGQYLIWDEIEAKDLTWDNIEHLPSDSKTHMSVNTIIPLYKRKTSFRVRAVDGTGYSEYLTSTLIAINPRSLAKYTPPCLHIPELHEGKPAELVWGDLYAAAGYVLERKLSGNFEKRYDGAGTPVPTPSDCDEWKKLWNTPDCKQHLAFTDQLPYYEKATTYRIKGYNSTDSSQYLQSAVVPIIPIFVREGTASFDVINGQSYSLQINAHGITSFNSIIITMEYDASQLILETPQRQLQYGIVNNLQPTVYSEISRNDGKLKFQCVRSISSGNEWAGFVAELQFKAVKTGTATVRLY